MFFILFKRKSDEKTLKVIFYYILYCILNELAGFLLHLVGINLSNFIYFLFNIAEFTFFAFFYYYALPTKLVKKGMPVLLSVFLIAANLNFFVITKRNEFDSLTMGIEAIVIIILCIYYLFIQLGKSFNFSIYFTFNFWVIISFLIYLAGTFFLYIMVQNMQANKHFQILYIIINSAFNILKNILLSVAMLMKPADDNSKHQLNKPDLDNLFSFQLKN